MLVKEISRTLLSKNASEVDRLIAAGYKLLVKKKGKVVFTINPPVQKEKNALEQDLTYLLQDPSLFTKIDEKDYDPFDYSSVPKSGEDDELSTIRLGYRES